VTLYATTQDRPALAPSARHLQGWVDARSAVPQRAVPGPPVDLNAGTWVPVVAVPRSRGRGLVRVAVSLVLGAVVLGIPVAATGAAVAVLKPATDVSKQHVPGEPPAGRSGPQACCTSAR
jgi:hypothetical protein